MALFPCNVGGGGTFAEGTIQLSSTAQNKITLGFKPSFFAFFVASSNVKALSLIFDESATGFATRGFAGSQTGGTSGTSSGHNLPNSSSNCINSIDSDGVTLGKITTSTYGTVGHYMAIK